MSFVTRRHILAGAAAIPLLGAATAAYSVGIEPNLLDVTRYKLSPAQWPADMPLRIAVLADFHACEPWMSAARVRAICAVANALAPDLTVVLGDMNGGHNHVTGPVMPDAWAEALSTLSAPLGVFAILGNHDWWHGALPRLRGDDGESVRRGFRNAGLTVLENDAVRLAWKGRPFWLLGLADQHAHELGRGRYRGEDDLPGTLARVTDAAPAILLAHEPFIFPQVPDRIALTLCGHTHGGQVNPPILGPAFARRRYGNYAYGHIVEGARHLVVSGGLGETALPIRFGRPPEVVGIELG